MMDLGTWVMAARECLYFEKYEAFMLEIDDLNEFVPLLGKKIQLEKPRELMTEEGEEEYQ
jgi:hypothetical protein